MIDVVFDTNVLVGALLKGDGSCRRAMRAVLAEPQTFSVCYSSQIMAEYEDVMSRPVITARGLQDEARALLALIRRVGHEVVPTPVRGVVYPDVDDRPFLELAVYVRGALVTCNLRDFPFLGVVILGPDEFLGWLDER